MYDGKGAAAGSTFENQSDRQSKRRKRKERERKMGEQYKYVIRSPHPPSWPLLLLLTGLHTLWSQSVSFLYYYLIVIPFSFCLEKIGNPLKLANQKEEEEEENEKKKATSLVLFSRAWMSSSSGWTFSSQTRETLERVSFIGKTISSDLTMCSIIIIILPAAAVAAVWQGWQQSSQHTIWLQFHTRFDSHLWHGPGVGGELFRRASSSHTQRPQEGWKKRLCHSHRHTHMAAV